MEGQLAGVELVGVEPVGVELAGVEPVRVQRVAPAVTPAPVFVCRQLCAEAGRGSLPRRLHHVLLRPRHQLLPALRLRRLPGQRQPLRQQGGVPGPLPLRW